MKYIFVVVKIGIKFTLFVLGQSMPSEFEHSDLQKTGALKKRPRALNLLYPS
jgi:hypothetical protein